MIHKFDVDIAAMYGIEAAVLLDAIFWDMQRSDKTFMVMKDGLLYKHYNIATLLDMCPEFWTIKMTKMVLRKLIKVDALSMMYSEPSGRYIAITDYGTMLIENAYASI